MTKAQECVGRVIVQDRVQERTLVVSGDPETPLADVFEETEVLIVAEAKPGTWWPDRVKHNDGTFDVVLLDGVPEDWKSTGCAALDECMRVLRPGGLLAGYVNLDNGITSVDVVERLKGCSCPPAEFQLITVESSKCFRLIKWGKPGLTLAFLCDARGNDTLYNAAKDMLDYAAEVIVFDTGIDGDEARPHLDPAVAEKLGAKLFHVPWSHHSGQMFNRLRYKASHEWIQILGDDCRIETPTAQRLWDAIEEAPDHIYSVELRHKRCGPTWHEKDLIRWEQHGARTFRNRWWIYFTGSVHEQIGSSMGVAGFPLAKHNQLIPPEEGYVIHWWNRPGRSRKEKFEYYAALHVRNDPKKWPVEFQAQAQRLDASVYGSPAQAERVERIVESCEGDVLDLGSGDGWIVAKIRDKGHKVTGVELSGIRCKRAVEEFGLELVEADVSEPLEFDDESFDTVVAGELLEHLDNPGGCLAEMARIARKRLVISIPIAEGFDADPCHKWAIRVHSVQDQMLVLVCDKINRENDVE